MGQKVNPNGLRLGINKDWEAKWYSNKKDFAMNLAKDVKIREFLTENLKNAGIAIFKPNTLSAFVAPELPLP